MRLKTSGCLAVFAAAAFVVSYGSAHARCDCPAPRPMKATAASAILPLKYSEEFEAERRRPDRADVVVIAANPGLRGHVQKVADEIEASMGAQLKKKGFTGTVNARVVSTKAENLMRDGFEFLGNRAVRDEHGKVVGEVPVYRRFSHSGGPPRMGTFSALVRVRAHVCVEPGEAHLTFDPVSRITSDIDLPPGANLPKGVVESKYAEFQRKVSAEVKRLELKLKAHQERLTRDQQEKVRLASVQEFALDAPVEFFGKRYQLPLRVSPLAKPRICDNKLGS